ncbi:hypothetical protein Tco_1307313 [Tanacetum coccineum]
MYHSRLSHKKAPAATILNGASYRSLLFCSSLTLNIHNICDAFFPAGNLTKEHVWFFSSEHLFINSLLLLAQDSMVDLRTCGVSEPPSSEDALSSESSLSYLPLSSKLPLFSDPSPVSELPPGFSLTTSFTLM